MKKILNKAAALWRNANTTQLLRHGVQLLSFLLFPGLFLTVFNALRDVAAALFTGTFALSALSGSLATLAVVLGVTALWGRFFCGYLCAFGALQELLSFAGKKLLPGRVTVPQAADKVLKYVKYGVLLGIVLLLWALQLPVDSTFSPWGVFGALLSGNLTVMGAAIPTVGFGLLLAILIGSLFVERAFCRYLCPLGALFTPLSAGRLFRIRRLESACTGCQRCTRDCAMGVTVHKNDFVRSGECIDCMRCVAVCRPEALRTLPHPAVAGTASALALCGLIQVGKLAVPEENASAGGYTGSQVVSAEAASPVTKYADGVYTGQGNGFRGAISAQVTVEGGRITDVTILSSQDDSDFLQRAQNGVIPAILNAQSVNVSAVSGATWSSRGILEAVADALALDASALPEVTVSQQREKGRRSGQTNEENGGFSKTPPAGDTGESGRQQKGSRSGMDQGQSKGQRFGAEQGQRSGKGQRQGGRDRASGQTDQEQPTQDPSHKTMIVPSQPEAQAPASSEGSPDQASAPSDRVYADGVYTGTGTGYRGATQVQVTVESGRITDVTVLSYADDRQYFSRAQSALIDAIFNQQGVDVSTVSGATFSSNGILEAVADALGVDFTNPNASLGGRRKGRS